MNCRYLTDDRDEDNPHELVVIQGGNGDYYVSVVPKGKRAMDGVRFCTSGGCAKENPRLLKAVRDMYLALSEGVNDATTTGDGNGEG